MGKVTYLLGAGASARALPVIANWNERIESFFGFLSYLIRRGGWESEPFQRLVREMNVVHKESKFHSSIDTYAKKLYLRKDEKLKVVKALISLFLIYEQSSDIEEIKDSYGTVIGIQPGGEGHLDNRYDSFFAATLDFDANDSITFNKDISILSWNYDYQFELAYSIFTGRNIDDARNDLKVFPRGKIKDDPSARIIKINGSVDLHDTIKVRAGTSGFYSSHVVSKEIKYPNFYTAFNIFASQCFDDNYHLTPSVSFAWEKSGLAQKQVSLANNIALTTTTLVVIGYSFPVFNRVMDKLIFYNTAIKKVYLQCSAEDVEAVKSRIRNTFNEHVRVIPISEIDQFYIPYEL